MVICHAAQEMFSSSHLLKWKNCCYKIIVTFIPFCNIFVADNFPKEMYSNVEIAFYSQLSETLGTLLCYM